MAKQVNQATAKKREEVLRSSTAIVDTYHYIDTEKGIDQLSREVYKKHDKEVHYPIGYNGGDKYAKTKKFSYIGFKKKLPIGVNKVATKGLGFTKILKPLMDYLEDNFNVTEIIFKKTGKSSFSSDKKTLTFKKGAIFFLLI